MGPLEHDDAPYVSTGQLPSPEQVRRAVDEAYQRYRAAAGGQRSRVYPALARVPADLFGICAVGTRGGVYATGDADYGFAIMSVAKPFVFALICQALGPEGAREQLGANATGLPFNSLAAVERGPDGRTNPMVNAGAITTASMAPGGSQDERWGFLRSGLSRFAGRPLGLDEEVYASASATNHRNRALANLLEAYSRLGCDPAEAVDLYTRQSCVRVSATGLAVMTTAGLYETSGDWLYDVGVPGKSGIGGGIVVVSPGKGALASFAPPLDEFGNSVKGQLAARFLSRRLGLTLFASEPAT